MKRTIFWGLLATVCATSLAQDMITVNVSNPTRQSRNDQAVVIDLKQYGDIRSALVMLDGKEIPCQLDDLDQDEQFDELCFLVDLSGKEKKKYSVTLYH